MILYFKSIADMFVQTGQIIYLSANQLIVFLLSFQS